MLIHQICILELDPTGMLCKESYILIVNIAWILIGDIRM